MTETPLTTAALLRLIRDARSTAPAERHLLIALALRCRPKEQYKAWPSYSRLVLDTGLSPITLKRAAKALEAKGLIRRAIRRNQANQWWINVPLLESQARKVAQKEAEEQESVGAAFRVEADAAPQPGGASTSATRPTSGTAWMHYSPAASQEVR